MHGQFLYVNWGAQLGYKHNSHIKYVSLQKLLYSSSRVLEVLKT